MSVNAITTDYYYRSTGYQMIYFGTSITAAKLQTLMQWYNITPTGDEHTDIQKLYNRMYSYYSKHGNISDIQSNQPSQQAYPWTNVMQKIGLSASGDLNQDYSNFKAALSTMHSLAKTNEEKQYTNNLLTEAQGAFVSIYAQQPQAPQSSGASILATIQKAFIVGIK